MHPHSRFWLFVMMIVIFLLLTTALGAASTKAEPVSGAGDPAAARSAAESLVAEEGMASERPETELVVLLILHVLATGLGLRAGMKLFYESTMFGGFCAILLIDALLVAGMHLAGPLSDGLMAMLGPQVVATGLVMVVTLRHFGFSKDRFTVIPTVLAAKALGLVAEVALRMLFRDVMLRWAGSLGW